jgi:hypothetical protein
MSSPILLASAIRSSTSEERDGIFGSTQHGNTKEMKGIGAFAHTGVPTCIHEMEMECRRGNCQVTKENLDGLNLNQNHSFSCLKHLGAGEPHDQDVSGLSGQMSTFICEGWVWVRI